MDGMISRPTTGDSGGGGLNESALTGYIEFDTGSHKLKTVRFQDWGWDRVPHSVRNTSRMLPVQDV